MRFGYAFFAAAVCFAGCACASATYSSSDDLALNSEITLVALSSESETLEAVEVTAVLSDGRERVLGRTDGFGRLRISREDLGEDVKILLFCREGFFCGALRTSEPSFHEYREHLIALARFMVS